MDEREFELINIIGKDLGSNQRDLSHKMDLSLGMINMLIRRLISKGYIRIEQLNKRKVQYLLTPKGFTEKMRKSVKYTLNTINSIGLIKKNVKNIIQEHYQKGCRKFYVYSETDLTIVIERAFNELNLEGCSFSVINELPDYNLEGILLIGKENVIDEKYNQDNRTDLVMELAKSTEIGIN